MSDNIKAIEEYPEISFIDGYQIEDLEQDMIRSFLRKKKELTGKEQSLDMADERRLLLSVCAYYLFLGYKYVDHAAKMGLLKYSTGDYLENLGALKGVSRLPASGAEVTIKYAMNAPRSSATPIPAGSRVSAGDNVYFATENYAEIPIGKTFVEIKARCLKPGSIGNKYPLGSLNIMVDPVAFIDTVSNQRAPENGRDLETDEDLRKRIYEAPQGYSSGGSRGAYEFMVRKYDPTVEDVKITSPSPRIVNIVVLLDGGKIPGTEYINGLKEFLSEDSRKMLTDVIQVKAPEVIKYNLSVKYFVNSSDKSRAKAIQEAVNAAVDGYKEWQQSRIGRDLNPDELRKRLLLAGAKRAEITSPTFQVTGESSLAVADQVSVTYGGLEDD